MNTIFLGLGTNLGDRQQNLQRAIDGLAAGVTITAVSPTYETPPWGVDDQPAFFNMCLAGKTDKTPYQLLKFIKDLEYEIGRVFTYRWGPRIIDIDILFFNDQIIIEPDLTIPHMHVAERAFVLVPLADIAPTILHPQSGKTVMQLAQEVEKMGIRPLPHVQLTIPENV